MTQPAEDPFTTRTREVGIDRAAGELMLAQDTDRDRRLAEVEARVAEKDTRSS